MIKIYYHVYVIDGVKNITSEQLTLLKKYIIQPYSLTVGISISENNKRIKNNIYTKFSFNKII